MGSIILALLYLTYNYRKRRLQPLGAAAEITRNISIAMGLTPRGTPRPADAPDFLGDADSSRPAAIWTVMEEGNEFSEYTKKPRRSMAGFEEQSLHEHAVPPPPPLARRVSSLTRERLARARRQKAAAAAGSTRARETLPEIYGGPIPLTPSPYFASHADALLACHADASHPACSAGMYKASIRAAAGRSTRRPAAATDGRYRRPSVAGTDTDVTAAGEPLAEASALKRAASLRAMLSGSRSYTTIGVSDAERRLGPGFDTRTNVELMRQIAAREQDTEQDVRKRTLETCRL